MPMPMTLEAARDWLRKRVRDGAECPCCTQLAKVYRRKMHAGMTRLLVLAARDHGREWFHITELGAGSGGDFAKFRYWGLIEPGKPDGTWRLTADGEDFARGRLRVPSSVEIYDGEALDLVGETVSVREALGHKFDYDELMATTASALPVGRL